MSFVNKLNNCLDNITVPVSVTIYGITLLLAGLQVLFRYVFDYSLYWAEEAMRYGFIWGTLLGVCICHSKGVNISIEALTSHLKDTTRAHVGLIVHLLSAFFFSVLIIYGYKLVLVTMSQTSAAMGIPMGYIYLSVPVSGAIMLLHTIESIMKHFHHVPDINREGVGK